MRTSIIITLCLAILQLSIAQNEEPAAAETTPSTSPPPSAEPSTEPSVTPETSRIPSTETPTVIPTTETSEPTTETSTTGAPVEMTTSVPSNKTNIKIIEKLSDQIRSILVHFREPEPTGFPGQTILRDPMPVPNATVELGLLGTGDFFNLTVHGLSNFTVEAVNLLLDEMQVYVMIRMKTIKIKGNLTVSTMFTTSRGPFNMTLTNVTAEGTVHLKADSSGKLQADKVTSDMLYQQLEVGSNSSSVFQTALNGAGMYVLMQIKPYMLNEIEKRLKEEVNKQLENTPRIPSVVDKSPMDLAVIEGRKYLRQYYEPLVINNVTSHDSEFLALNIGPVTIHGLSKFARVGNITMQMKDGVIQLIGRFITGRISGSCKFFYDFGKVGVTRSGESLFIVEHFQFEVKLNQSMNLRSKPILDDFQMEIGRMSVKMDGKGDFDFVVDLVVQLMPDMIRHLIIDSSEEIIKHKLQSEILDRISVEQLVEEHLPIMEKFFIY